MTRIPCLKPLSVAFLAAVTAGCVANSRNSASLGIGGGHYEIKAAGDGSGDARAALLEAGFESIASNDFGGGVRARAVVTDDDLDTDGPGPDPASFRASDGEWYFHGSYDSATDDRRMPVRFGLFVRSFAVEETTADEEIRWNSFGPRAEFAPEWTLQQWDKDTISAFAMVGAGYGFTTVESTLTANDWETDGVFLDLGVGMRGAFNGLMLDVGYRYLSAHYAETEVSAATTVRETDTTFSGFVFSIGGRF